MLLVKKRFVVGGEEYGMGGRAQRSNNGGERGCGCGIPPLTPTRRSRMVEASHWIDSSFLRLRPLLLRIIIKVVA